VPVFFFTEKMIFVFSSLGPLPSRTSFARDRRAAAGRAALGEGQEERSGTGEILRQCHVEQAALATGEHLRNAGEGIGKASLGEKPHAAGAFGHDHRTVRQEIESPWMHEAVGQNLGADLDLFRVEDLACRLGKRCRDEKQKHRDKSKTEETNGVCGQGLHQPQDRNCAGADNSGNVKHERAPGPQAWHSNANFFREKRRNVAIFSGTWVNGSVSQRCGPFSFYVARPRPVARAMNRKGRWR
jgi:hypothetical protein